MCYILYLHIILIHIILKDTRYLKGVYRKSDYRVYGRLLDPNSLDTSRRGRRDLRVPAPRVEIFSSTRNFSLLASDRNSGASTLSPRLRVP